MGGSTSNQLVGGGLAMDQNDKLIKILDRFEKWGGRFDRIVSRSMEAAQSAFLGALRELEEKKEVEGDRLKAQEQRLGEELESAGKSHAQKKYALERDRETNRAAIEKLEGDYKKVQAGYREELSRLNEDREKLTATFERQKLALQDLFREKRRHLSSVRSKLTRELQQARENHQSARKKVEADLAGLRRSLQEKIDGIQKEKEAKEQGWKTAEGLLQNDVQNLTGEKEALEKKIAELREKTDEELASIRLAIQMAKEQLEVDKASLIEKAQEEERETDRDIASLQAKIAEEEKELQKLILEKEGAARNAEERFEEEENALREALKAEAARRDYEQKLFEGEKLQKEKELNRLKDDYEKKKWYWDNQIRNLTMKKSVQEAEFDAEKMRADREARVTVKSLRSKFDEMRQQLANLKSRREALEKQKNKDDEIRGQRFRWRKDRLWSLWQSRLETMKKERLIIEEKLDALLETFERDRSLLSDREARENRRIEEIHQQILHVGGRQSGLRRQREIQFELEKTRLLAQIKECETLLSDWTDRLKRSQEEAQRDSKSFGEQMSFLEKFFRQEEQETEVFLHQLRGRVTDLEAMMARLDLREDAA